MTRFRLFAPEREMHALRFRWDVSPRSDLYRSKTFILRFPAAVPLDRVSDRVVFLIAMLCLHAHWLLLRPCVVELPFDPGPEERDFWRRLLEVEAATLDTLRPEGPLADPTLEIRVTGPALSLDTRPPDAAEADVCAAAFSGGKDSLLQAALLAELTSEPILVTTTSPLPPLSDHRTARRRAILRDAPAKLGARLYEVETGFRSSWDNAFGERRGYRIGVNEVTDTFLYLAATLAVGAAFGARHLFLASEAEVQETVEREGRTIQHPHFMYSLATQEAISALLSRLGFRCGSVTGPLWSEQVQRLLWTRYPRVCDLQYSCWRVGESAAACSRCGQCLRVALTAIAAGGNPERMGIDLAVLFSALEAWRPRALQGSDPLPAESVARGLHEQVVRSARAVAPSRVWSRLVLDRPRALFERRTYAAVRAYRMLRRGLLPYPVGAAPGYRAAFLSSIDPLVREGISRIYSTSFTADESPASAESAARSRRLASWVAAPLGARA